MQTLSSRQVYANPWMTVREDAVRRDDGSDGIFGVIDKPTAAVVIPFDGERFHLVEQFRYPVAGRMDVLGQLDLAPGMSSQREHVFLATELTAGDAAREHAEHDMRTGWFTTAELESMIREGEIVDAQTLAAYLLLKLR